MEGLKRTGEQIGGIERFQLAERVLCATIAERERNKSCWFCLHISKKNRTFADDMRFSLAYLFRQACRLVCVLGLLCGFASCKWHEVKEVIITADSLDQNEHVIYDDTAALGKAIRSLDNPFGRLLMPNTLGKAYYYMGRNLSFANEIADAAECYIEADRLQIDDPIYRGRVNSCMGYICVQNCNDSLALIFYERATEDFKESGNDWYYAQSILNLVQCRIDLQQYSIADSLLYLAQSYQLDSAYQARRYETKGLYFYEQQHYDSALVYLERGLNYWQFESEKCFSYLKIMQVYFDLNELHQALPYAKLILSTSNNPNYISNAYYCLMQDAKCKNNAELLSQYSHARTDAQRLLRQAMLHDAEALSIFEEYLCNPHPWRWVWITIIGFIILCCILIVCIIAYRKQFAIHLNDVVTRLHKANEEIDNLSTNIKEQEVRYSDQERYLAFETYLIEIRTRFPQPKKQWVEYALLKKDIAPYLHRWISELETLGVSDSECALCIYSLLYPHLSLQNIADYMNYSYDGLRVLKSRFTKRVGLSANFYESMKIWAMNSK